MRTFIAVMSLMVSVHVAMAAEWSTDLSSSRATTLTCKGNGKVGVFYFENNGSQADKGCVAHCEWVDTKGKSETSDSPKYDIPEDFKGSKASVSLSFDILESKNAKLTCS